ncbi:MAG: hypothetical protein FWG16_08615, partial [Micrococcales bacterium]|nr:hypothetical protein [Micrococcales bacterium]
LQFDEDGKPVFNVPNKDRPGQPAISSLEALSDQLAELTDQYQAEVAGVSLCSNYDGVALFVAPGGEGAVTRFEEVVSLIPQLAFHVFEVPFSNREILNRQDKILDDWHDLQWDYYVTGFEPDIYTGGMLIYFDPVLLTDNAPLEKSYDYVSDLIGRDMPLRILFSKVSVTVKDW